MAQQDIQTQDGVSTLYNIATDKHLLKSGMTEDEFRKQIGSEKGQKSFYNYAKSHGLKMRPYDDFVQRYFGTPSV